MKKFVFAFVVLCSVTLWLIACKSSPVNFVQTSYLVSQAGVHKGDSLVFQVPAPGKDKRAKNYYVHFAPEATPCANFTIPASGTSAQCDVIATPTSPTRYFFSINESPDSAPIHKGCPPWFCSGVVVVGPPSGPDQQPQGFLPPAAGALPAIELMIYDSGDGPAGVPGFVPQKQPVTWITNGIDTAGGSVTFKDDICVEKQPITWVAGDQGYCTIKDDASPGVHLYNLTVSKVTGPDSQITVMKNSSALTITSAK